MFLPITSNRSKWQFQTDMEDWPGSKVPSTFTKKKNSHLWGKTFGVQTTQPTRMARTNFWRENILACVCVCVLFGTPLPPPPPPTSWGWEEEEEEEEEEEWSSSSSLLHWGLAPACMMMMTWVNAGEKKSSRERHHKYYWYSRPPSPTSNGGMQKWKLSRNACTRRKHVFAHSLADLHASVGAWRQKFSASELRRKFIRSALLVGSDHGKERKLSKEKKWRVSKIWAA